MFMSGKSQGILFNHVCLNPVLADVGSLPKVTNFGLIYRIYSAIRRLVYKTKGMFWPLRERILLSLAYKTGLNFCKFPTSHQCLHCV